MADRIAAAVSHHPVGHGLAGNETPEMAVSKLPAAGDGRALVILLDWSWER